MTDVLHYDAVVIGAGSAGLTAAVSLAQSGARATLRTNFRTRPEIIDVLNPAFTKAMGEDYTPLRAGRDAAGDPEPRVELMIVENHIVTYS